MNTTQNAIYGLRNMVKMLLGQVSDPQPHSTMNERLDIQATAKPVAGEKLMLGILTAGNKGHLMAVGVEGIPLTSIKDHMATDASLYGPVPFALREVDNDFDINARARYALRKELLFNGINYYAYYGLRIDTNLEDVNVETLIITKEPDQPDIEVPFVPSTSNLYPEGVELPPTGAVTTTDVSVGVRALLPVSMTENVITEYINAIKILYNGDERYAIWSEFCLNTAVNRQISVPSTAGSVNFMEAIGVQAYAFAADYKAVFYNTQELNLTFDVGCQIPLLGTMSIPTLETIGTDFATQNV
jgi:hypothetical protein